MKIHIKAKKYYFVIDALCIEVTSSTPYVFNFLKKQYNLVSSTKKHPDYQIVFDIDPLSTFKMQIYKIKIHLDFFFSYALN